MNKYHIRYNTQHNGNGLLWRIFENGNEMLATDVKIFVDSFTEQTMEGSDQKYNIACFGYAVWFNNAVKIIGEKSD